MDGSTQQRIAALEGSCDPGPPLETAIHLVPPPPTGSGPPEWMPPPVPLDPAPRSSCDNPGAGCLTSIVIENDPTDSSFGGQQGTFPGN